MYGIIGEADSDADTLKELVRRLLNNKSITIRTKGYNNCSEMLKRGATQLKALSKLDCTRFVVAYDSDGCSVKEREEEVLSKIVRPAGIQDFCILIPVQEIESWILADIQAVSKVFSAWKPDPIRVSPESIASPKEYLETLSKRASKNKKPFYDHATYNHVVARHLDLNIVYQRCPSFQPLKDFVIPS